MTRCSIKRCSRPTAPGLEICKAHAKQKADRLLSRKVRTDARCRRCGTRSNLQCAHVISRRYLATRWDIENVMPLCRGCHKYFTERPLEWDMYIEEEILGEVEYANLKKRALAGGKVDYAALLGWLERG